MKSTLFSHRLAAVSSYIFKMAATSEAIASLANPAKRVKLTGRAFYESIGSPKMIVAPMVDRSEFAWRLLTRSYLDEESSKSLLAYTPMLHARLFSEQAKFRDAHFQPTRESLTSVEKSNASAWLDGNPKNDRPLFVQFCANKADDLYEAAKYVAPYCDAVDLNLGCPQGIARSGHYGAFLQEDWDTIRSLIRKLHDDLPVPVTAKMRVLETKEKTLEYARMILAAGASILTVHGRRREQKGHNMGLADWEMIRYLRDNLPPETVLFANGNILNHSDIKPCLQATGADGIMSAEGNLSDPTIFAKPPTDADSREYWRGKDDTGGYRLDGVFRRYMDIIHRYVLEQDPPAREPLYIESDPVSQASSTAPEQVEEDEPPKKKRKKDTAAVHNPNLKAMQGHLFQLLRPMLSVHTDVRDALARSRAGDIGAFENVLQMVESAIRKGIQEEAAQKDNLKERAEAEINPKNVEEELTPSQRTIAKYKRPWWVCQPYIRPLPDEAIKIGAMTLSKKDKKRLDMEQQLEEEEKRSLQNEPSQSDQQMPNRTSAEVPAQPAVVCG